MKLVPDWRHVWKWHSTHAAALLAALPSAWIALPPEIKEAIPQGALPWIGAGVFVAFIIGRVKDQPNA